MRRGLGRMVGKISILFRRGALGRVSASGSGGSWVVPCAMAARSVEIAPAADGLLAATVRRAAAGVEILYARKIALATGQEGMGDWTVPRAAAPSAVVAPCATQRSRSIFMRTRRGNLIAVIGDGGLGLRQCRGGAGGRGSEVHLFCRRAEIQVIQPYRWLTFPGGFLRHFCDLDDALALAGFMRAILEMWSGFPQATRRSLCPPPKFSPSMTVRRSKPPDKSVWHGVELQTPRGVFAADFVICGTGIDMNFAGRRELRNCAANIAVWADRYQPPADERSPRLGRFPYLVDDYALIERVAGDGGNTVDRQHPCLCDCLHHELRCLRFIDQCDDHGGAEARAWADLRPDGA